MANDLSSITAGQNALAAQGTPDSRFANFLSNQSNMLANQQTMRTQQSQMGINNAIQQNIDPTTGQLNTGGASIAISNDPNITVGAQDAINSIYSNKLQQMNLTSDQQQQMATTTGIFANGLRTLVAAKQVAAQKSGNPADAMVNMNDVTSGLADIYNRGAFGDPSSSQAKQALHGLIQGIPTDPAQLTQYVQVHAVDQANWHAALQQSITGQPNDVDDGTNITPSMRNLNTGVNTPTGPGFQKGPTRAALAAPVQTGNLPDTTPTYSPTSSVLSRGGAPMGGAGGYMGGAPGGQAPVFTGNGSYPQQNGAFAGPGAPVTPGFGGPGMSPAGSAPIPPSQAGQASGSIPPAAGPPPGQGAAAAPPPMRMPPPPQQGQMAPGAPPAPVGASGAPPASQPWTMGMSPQQLAAAQQGMTAGVTQYKGDQAAIPVQKAGLANAQQALQGFIQAGPTGTGLGTASFNTLKATYGQFSGALSAGFGISLPGGAAAIQSVANYDDLHKLLVANASQMAASAGPHSNEGLAAAVSGNASTSISNLASQDVMKTQIALARMRQFPALSYAGSPDAQGDTTGTNYPAYAAKVATTMDPRAFVFDLLNASQRAKVIASLSPPGTPPKVAQANQLRFYDDVSAAQRVGLVTPNGQAPAATFAPGQ